MVVTCWNHVKDTSAPAVTPEQNATLTLAFVLTLHKHVSGRLDMYNRHVTGVSMTLNNSANNIVISWYGYIDETPTLTCEICVCDETTMST